MKSISIHLLPNQVLNIVFLYFSSSLYSFFSARRNHFPLICFFFFSFFLTFIFLLLRSHSRSLLPIFYLPFSLSSFLLLFLPSSSPLCFTRNPSLVRGRGCRKRWVKTLNTSAIQFLSIMYLHPDYIVVRSGQLATSTYHRHESKSHRS